MRSKVSTNKGKNEIELGNIEVNKDKKDALQSIVDVVGIDLVNDFVKEQFQLILDTKNGKQLFQIAAEHIVDRLVKDIYQDQNA